MTEMKPCPECGSSNLTVDSTACAEIYGVCYQSVWVECVDCGASSDSFSADDNMNSDDVMRLTVALWNEGKMDI